MATDHELLLQMKARQEELARQIQEARDIKTIAAAYPPSNTGTATINVNMGGWGVAVAVCAALFSLLLVIDMRSDARDTRRQVERTQDYTNMLWQRYPELRPERLKQSEAKSK